MEIDEQIKEKYYQSQGLKTRDIGSVYLLRKEVNNQLKESGYKPLKGYIPKKQLYAINRTKGITL